MTRTPQGSAVLQHGRIRYFAARKATLTVATPLAHHKVVHVTFGRDGIFVQSPYFHSQQGIASRVQLGPSSGAPYRLKLDEHGRVTSHLVKLSHHVDGRVYFSQHGRVRTEISRQSFRLDTSIGLLFELFAFWLSGFELFDPKSAKRDRAYLQFHSPGSNVFAVRIHGEWRRKAALEANIDPEEEIAGPRSIVVNRKTGVESQVFFLGAPPGSIFGTHVLVLSCRETRLPNNVTRPRVILIGGWDAHEAREGQLQVEQTGCLVCSYPVTSPEELAARIGSIDLEPPGAVRG